MQNSMTRPKVNRTYGNSKGKVYTSTLPPIKKERDTRINNQGREKLCQMLTQKFIQKFDPTKTHIELIHNEVANFLKQEKVNDQKLKLLEKKIKENIEVKDKHQNLKVNLKKELQVKNDFVEENPLNAAQSANVGGGNSLNALNNEKNKKKENLDDSRMSGASDLDKFDIKLNSKASDTEFLEFKKFVNENEEPKVEKVHLDYSKYANEWDAINMYNKEQFELQKKREKLKDIELKMRTKADLNNQIKQKIKREYEEKLNELEYDRMQDEHLKKMAELEKEKQKEIKNKALKEKEMRDQQMREQYVTNRIAFLKNKKYERQLVEHNKKEIQMAKELEMKRKKDAHDALLKTLKDNEENKKRAKELLKKEKEDDIRMMEDAAAMEIRQENERKAYFKSIEKSANAFMDSSIANVIKRQQDRKLEEEEKLREYQEMKNKMEDEAEAKKLKEIKENKIKLRQYYDKQVLDKKKKEDYEHQVDLKQGDIWNRDVKKYNEQEKEIKKIIRDMAVRNLKALDEQVKGKENENKKYYQGMSETEQLLNRDILEKANNMGN